MFSHRSIAFGGFRSEFFLFLYCCCCLFFRGRTKRRNANTSTKNAKICDNTLRTLIYFIWLIYDAARCAIVLVRCRCFFFIICSSLYRAPGTKISFKKWLLVARHNVSRRALYSVSWWAHETFWNVPLRRRLYQWMCFMRPINLTLHS